MSPRKEAERSGNDTPLLMSADSGTSAHSTSSANVTVIKPRAVYDSKVIKQDELRPLLEAVAKLDRIASRCSSFIAEFTYKHPVSGTLKTIARYDDSKSPANRINIILINNDSPNDEQQKSLAEGEMKSYDGRYKTGFSGWMDQLRERVKYGACRMEINNGILRYKFTMAWLHIESFQISNFYINGNYTSRTGQEFEYDIDVSTGNLICHKKIFHKGVSVRDVFGEKLTLLETSCKFTYSQNNAAPNSITFQSNFQTSASETGDGQKRNVTSTAIYKDYKTVTCYDDLLRVNVGEQKVVEMPVK